MAFPYSTEVRSAYLIRLLSLVLSAVTVWLIYFMVREIWPNENMLALATAFFVATIPQFVHISASISNTNLATTLSTAYLLSLMYYLKNNLKPARAFLCGILLGCSLLSSTFTIFYVPVTICIILWISFRTGKNILTGLLIILSVTGFVSGWWFIRNWTHYHDPLLSRAIVAVYPWIVRSRMPSLGDLSEVIENSFVSFFGYFVGTFQFTISTAQLSLYVVLIMLGTCGLLRLSIVSGKETTLNVFQRQTLIMFWLSLLAALAFFAIVNFRYHGMFAGRYLYPVIAPFAVFLFTNILLQIKFLVFSFFGNI
jgi:4-amino-4-deoxy-L-arabinose transferase-like glycosyltransferase